MNRDKSVLELLSFLHTNQPSMVAQLHQFCEINSSTDNLQGLKTMHNTLQKAFAPIADHVESHRLPPISTLNMTGGTDLLSCGDILFIRKRPELKQRYRVPDGIPQVDQFHLSLRHARER